MPRIEWDESFSMNNAEIDTQHKKWIEIMNELHETLIGNDSEKVMSIAADSLESMQEYAKTHFAYEEEYMQGMNYPDLAEHKSIHNAFNDRLVRYQEEIQRGETILNTVLMKVLSNWLLNHILEEDKKYCLYVSGGKAI